MAAAPDADRMRRIIAFDNVSADGCFADAEGKLDWVVQDPDLMAENADAARSARGSGTLLFGRRTYEMFAAFWPHVTRETPAPHGDGAISAEMLDMADMLNASQKVVYSRTLKDPSWKNTRVARAFDAKEVEVMKRAPGDDIMVFGSGSIVSQLAAHGLLDELQLQVSPIVLGNGKRLLAELTQPVELELLEATPSPKTGVVRMRYAPRRTPRSE
jgi:dihydrofolate reductase